jgi:hypothetical protein
MKNYTYMGTADDVVRRYPWKHGWNINSINNQLIHSVIYDQNLVINDGYLVANPELLASLKNLNKSLLGNTLLSGTAVLFCRSEPKNLAEGLLRSKEKLKTHEKALSGVNENIFIRRMETLQKYVNQNPIQWPKDKNTGAIFAKFLDKLNYDNCLDLSLPSAEHKKDFNNVYKIFSDEMDVNFNEARQQWERICWGEFGNLNIDNYDPFDPSLRKKPCYDRVRTMMQVANEAYHVAYTAAMSWSLRDKDVHSRPLTAFCPAYLDVFKKSIAVEKEEHLRYEGLGSVLISVDLVKFGKDCDFSWVRELVLNDEVVEIRKEYLRLLNDYIRWKGSLKEVQNLANQYRNILSKLVADSTATYSDIAESLFNFFGGNQVTSALQAINSLRSQVGISTPVNLDPVKSVKEIVETREIADALERPGLNSIWYGSTKSLARELGLINAPLDKAKVEDILLPIKPYNPHA